ncbi:MAG: class I SAM-dependent methyltransferase [Rhodoglobus sp.]|nr:class I SAM-dependent methyltransferase [Rhodoglobus sp.]
MGFDIPAEAYDRFMGRYSNLLSPLFADFAGVESGQRALDVGCGPGALTAELVSRLGTDAVAAVDPSVSFVEAARERYPEVDIREAKAENLPFPDDTFDVALAQLVVHFMKDPVAGITEMRRVVRDGGVVAATVWDFVGERSPLTVFWQAARELDSTVRDDSAVPGASEGDLTRIFTESGLGDVREVPLEVSMLHSSFDDWWVPYMGGVGPVGSYFASLTEKKQEAVRERCREMLPRGSFTLVSRAWAARGIA